MSEPKCSKQLYRERDTKRQKEYRDIITKEGVNEEAIVVTLIECDQEVILVVMLEGNQQTK